MSCPELYSQVKSDNNFFLAGILGARSQFFKDFFRALLFSSGNLESCPELYSKVKSDKKFIFWGGLFGLLYFRREISVLK